MSICSSNVTSGFIDLATFDELEKYMYGGPDATAYFVRETRKATWFTQVPVVLSRATGNAAFGQEWSVGKYRCGCVARQPTDLRYVLAGTDNITHFSIGTAGISITECRQDGRSDVCSVPDPCSNVDRGRANEE